MTFDGFETTYTDTPSGARVFAYVRKGDSKLPVLVLLHGYPQNALKYKEFVKEIPTQWPLLVPDLPGWVHTAFQQFLQYSLCFDLVTETARSLSIPLLVPLDTRNVNGGKTSRLSLTPSSAQIPSLFPTDMTAALVSHTDLHSIIPTGS